MLFNVVAALAFVLRLEVYASGAVTMLLAAKLTGVKSCDNGMATAIAGFGFIRIVVSAL
jgi:hypothetical protein